MVVRCVRLPKPPPNWPTISNDVGTVLGGGGVPPAGVGGWNERLLVRLIVRSCPDGTVITIGDQPPLGFSAAQVGEPDGNAVPVTAPQV